MKCFFKTLFPILKGKREHQELNLSREEIENYYVNNSINYGLLIKPLKQIKILSVKRNLMKGYSSI